MRGDNAARTATAAGAPSQDAPGAYCCRTPPGTRGERGRQEARKKKRGEESSRFGCCCGRCCHTWKTVVLYGSTLTAARSSTPSSPSPGRPTPTSRLVKTMIAGTCQAGERRGKGGKKGKGWCLSGRGSCRSLQILKLETLRRFYSTPPFTPQKTDPCLSSPEQPPLSCTTPIRFPKPRSATGCY